MFFLPFEESSKHSSPKKLFKGSYCSKIRVTHTWVAWKASGNIFGFRKIIVTLNTEYWKYIDSNETSELRKAILLKIKKNNNNNLEWNYSWSQLRLQWKITHALCNYSWAWQHCALYVSIREILLRNLKTYFFLSNKISGKFILVLFEKKIKNFYWQR